MIIQSENECQKSIFLILYYTCKIKKLIAIMKALTSMRVIAVDLGATSGRVVTINYKDGIIENEIIHRFSNYLINKNNQLLWDLNKIINN